MCRSADNPSTPAPTRTGRTAEDAACAYLSLRGYEILDRNLRLGPLEIDIVASVPGWIVLVEVRYRGRTDRGLPEETIHPGKRRRLLRAGEAYWMRYHPQSRRLRFDLVSLSVTPDGMRLRHYPHFLVPGVSCHGRQA